MRKDLDKLLCEKPRIGHKRKHKDIRNRKKYKFSKSKIDSNGEYHGYPVPRKEGIRKPYKRLWVEKDFGEHLAPLRGLLHKNVGRKWDDIFSEIRKSLKIKNGKK